MLAGYGVLLRCEWEETKTRREKRKERRDDPGLGRLVMLYFSVCCFHFLGLGRRGGLRMRRRRIPLGRDGGSWCKSRSRQTPTIESTDYHDSSMYIHLQQGYTLQLLLRYTHKAFSHQPSDRYQQIPSLAETRASPFIAHLHHLQADPAQVPPQQPNQPNSYTYHPARPHLLQGGPIMMQIASFLFSGWLPPPLLCLTQKASQAVAGPLPKRNSSFCRRLPKLAPLVPLLVKIL